MREQHSGSATGWVIMGQSDTGAILYFDTVSRNGETDEGWFWDEGFVMVFYNEVDAAATFARAKMTDAIDNNNYNVEQVRIVRTTLRADSDFTITKASKGGPYL